MPEPRQPEPFASRAHGTGQSSVVPLNPARNDEIPTVIVQPPAVGAAEAFHLAAGEVLAHFEVIRPLGAGGMASVFLANDQTLGREVALKILPPDLARDPDAVARFKQEAKAAAKLNHEAVARVFYTGEDRGLHFIAFEFVDGETLRAMIDRLGTVPPADCTRYLFDVANGLHHASGRGVVHRDVKPSNIVVTPDGRAKLIDMGLAREIDPQAVNGGVTQSGTTLGTFDYISPEQAIDPRGADVRSDIYSLGCTFYHALTGRPPVPDGNAARKLAAHQGEQPTDPRLINHAVPDDLAEVLGRMMAKRPEDRYPSAAELMADVTRVGRRMGVPLDSTGVFPNVAAERTPPAPRSPGRSLSTGLVLSGAVVVAAVAVIVSVWSQPTSLQTPPWAAANRPTGSAEVTGVEPATVRPVVKAVAVATAEELVKAVKDGAAKLTLTPGATYDLTATDGLLVSGKSVEWDAPADPKPTTVRVAAPPLDTRTGDGRTGWLTFHKCEAVKLRGVRFEIVQTADDAVADSVGVAFQDVGRVDLIECRFEFGGQVGSPDGVGVIATRTGPFAARNCFFDLKTWTAVELSGVVKAEFTECGFDTLGAGVEVAATEGGSPVGLTLRHVTMLLRGQAVGVAVGRDARCEVTAGYCVFAAPAPDPSAFMMTDADRKPAVLRAEGADATFAAADGQPSAASRVELPVVASGPPLEFLSTSPWAATPKVDSDHPWGILELNPKLKPLRPTTPGVFLLGVRALPTEQRKLYDPWPPAPPAAGPKVWYPNPPADEAKSLPANVYTDLAQAVAACKGRDVLEVRANGVVEVPQAVVLTDPRRSLTVRPEKNFAPLLKPAADGRKDAALFRLEAGELTLDGLAFQVRAGGVGGEDGTAAVVSMSGGKRCEVKNCVVTLDEQGGDRATVIAMTDVSDLMKKEMARPVIRVENCLVRGHGRLLRTPSAPLDVTVANVAAAVSGPLFEFAAPTRSPLPTGGVSVELSHLTAVLGGPLFDMRTGRALADDKPNLLPVEVRADGCLFTLLEANTTPLVQIAGCDPTAADKCLTWMTGVTGNGYSGWTVLAEVTGTDTTAEPKRWDAAEWRQWSGERDGSTGRVVWAKPPAAGGLTTVRSADLELTTNPFDDGIGMKSTLLPRVEE